MPSKLGKYHLLSTLGQGGFSKVKLAKNSDDHKHYAIKIHKVNDPKFDKSCVEIIETEVKAMSKLNHPNIVNIVEYIPKAKVEKIDKGTGYDVACVIVEEVATGGELFYYVKNSGYFQERFARHYFL
jgi:serine/threonine protein kinase